MESQTLGCHCQAKRNKMKVSYKKLWKLLIDKDMKKKDLCAVAGISPASVTKMGRGGHVTTEILQKICLALDCDVGDILALVPDRVPTGGYNDADETVI